MTEAQGDGKAGVPDLESGEHDSHANLIPRPTASGLQLRSIT